MGQIVYSERVKRKLKKLVDILYDKEYFGFLDTAENYVNSIRDTINSIPDLKHGKSKDPKVGKFFVRHKPNKNTTYYITFDCKGDRYYIEDIITNHEEDYKKVMGVV